jgi:hypothetical protein
LRVAQRRVGKRLLCQRWKALPSASGRLPGLRIPDRRPRSTTWLVRRSWRHSDACVISLQREPPHRRVGGRFDVPTDSTQSRRQSAAGAMKGPGVSTRFLRPMACPLCTALCLRTRMGRSSQPSIAPSPVADGLSTHQNKAPHRKTLVPLKLAAATQPGLPSTRIGDWLEKNISIISITYQNRSAHASDLVTRAGHVWHASCSQAPAVRPLSRFLEVTGGGSMRKIVAPDRGERGGACVSDRGRVVGLQCNACTAGTL